jgi:hypothetical protein
MTYKAAKDQLCDQLKESTINHILYDQEGLDVFMDIFMTDTSNANRIMNSNTTSSTTTTKQTMNNKDRIFVQIGFKSKQTSCV